VSRPPRRLARRLFVGQLLVVVIGAATLGAVAFLVAPPIFHDHVARAVGPVSDVVAHHLDQALSETLLLALVIGIVASAGAAAGMSWVLATRIARPVEQLSTTAGQLAAGRLDARAPRPAGDDELADLTVAFNGMADALETTEQTRRRLLSDLAHELRTPLATLEAYHEALVDGVVEPTDETWTTLQDATSRLQRLVEDLGLVSRAEEGRLELDRTDLDLREIVTLTVEALRPAAETDGVTVTTQLPDELPVHGDGDRLAQVLANLLRNALEHTPPGGAITVTGHATDEHVVIDVTDTGDGIAAEHLPHLFDRFYRADPARRHTGGSGIGLTISRAIARGHRGELTAASTGPGHGATFSLRLPR
jgi:two-component system, OmpR family, sensor histidine kinase BaeS